MYENQCREEKTWERTKNAFSASIKYARVSYDINILGINDSVVDKDYSELDLLTGFRQSFAKWQQQSTCNTVKSRKIKISLWTFLFEPLLILLRHQYTAALVAKQNNYCRFQSRKSAAVELVSYIQHFCRKKSGSKSLDSFWTITTCSTITDECKFCNHACGTVLHNS